MTQVTTNTLNGHIDAGFIHYIQPTPRVGEYIQIFDYKQELAAPTSITVNPSTTVIAGTPLIKTYISTAPDDDAGLPITTAPTFGAEYLGNQTRAQNFRYVKVRLEFDQDTGETVNGARSIGATTVTVSNANAFYQGLVVRFGDTDNVAYEITSINSNVLTISNPSGTGLAAALSGGETVYTADSIVEVNPLTVTLDIKLKTDSGKGKVTGASPSSGETVNFGISFLDVETINLSLNQHSTAYVNGNQSGTYTGISVKDASGVADSSMFDVGDVISFGSVTATQYEIAAVNTSLDTIDLVAAGGAPTLTNGQTIYFPQAKYAIYDFDDLPSPTSFIVYLFDENGNFVNGSFSWSARGY